MSEHEAEIARLHRFCLALAERIAAASEVLSRVAERKENRSRHATERGMMSDTNELRAAAERRRANPGWKGMAYPYPTAVDDAIVLANAYLAVHPADDGERATERWVSAAIDWYNRDGRHDVLLSVVRLSITKGTFRRLCVDLGITLKEGGA